MVWQQLCDIYVGHLQVKVIVLSIAKKQVIIICLQRKVRYARICLRVRVCRHYELLVDRLSGL